MVTSQSTRRNSLLDNWHGFVQYSRMYLPATITGTYTRQQIKEWKVKEMLRYARTRSRDKPFDLQVSDLVLPDVCPVLGIKLDYLVLGRRKDSSPSLDRMIPDLGYVKGNVRVISWRANRLKSDAAIEELVAVAEYVANNWSAA